MNTNLDLKDLKELNFRFKTAAPTDIIHWAYGQFGRGLVMTTAFGDRSAFALHFITTIIPKIPVIVIDPRFFFPESDAFMVELHERLGLNLEICYAKKSPKELRERYPNYRRPDHNDSHAYQWERKEMPLGETFKKLRTRAWMPGVKGYQTDVRRALDVVERRDDGVYKIHPFLRFTKEEVEAYMAKYRLPYHPLVKLGYDSVGDADTTEKGTDRKGRFHLGKETECVLHGNKTS